MLSYAPPFSAEIVNGFFLVAWYAAVFRTPSFVVIVIRGRNVNVLKKTNTKNKTLNDRNQYTLKALETS